MDTLVHLAHLSLALFPLAPFESSGILHQLLAGDLGLPCTQLYGDYFIKHEIMIPIKQPVFWESETPEI